MCKCLCIGFCLFSVYLLNVFLSVFNSISSLILHFTTECHDKKPLRLFCLIAYRLLLWNKNYYSCQYICQPNPFYPQNEVWHFCDIEIDGDVKKFVQFIKYTPKSHFNVLYLRQFWRYKVGRPHFGKLLTFKRLSLELKYCHFNNYRKSKTILKSSLNFHVYWDTLYVNL